MRKSQFSKHLKELNEEELRQELAQLYAQVPEVKQYYAMELGSEKERQRLYDKAKKAIEAKYATKSYRRPRRPRIQKINRILSEMKKATIFQHELVDLYLYDIEAALVFSVKYHFFSKVLANHIVTIFKRAMKIVNEQQIRDMFEGRCIMIVERSIMIPEIHSEIKGSYNEVFK